MKPSIELAKRAIAGEKAFAVYFPDPAKDMAELASQVMEAEGVRFWISPFGDSITCTKCRNTSRNQNDVKERYCGSCHVFLDEVTQSRSAEEDEALEAFTLFETMMSTDELLRLQSAYRADLAEATRPESIAFVGGRLALIAEVLKRIGTA